jgi:hypothetical protein
MFDPRDVNPRLTLNLTPMVALAVTLRLTLSQLLCGSNGIQMILLAQTCKPLQAVY